jgi:hypothetical protein
VISREAATEFEYARKCVDWVEVCLLTQGTDIAAENRWRIGVGRQRANGARLSTNVENEAVPQALNEEEFVADVEREMEEDHAGSATAAIAERELRATVGHLLLASSQTDIHRVQAEGQAGERKDRGK